MGEGPVGNQKATLHDPLGGLSFCAFVPTSGMGAGSKAEVGQSGSCRGTPDESRPPCLSWHECPGLQLQQLSQRQLTFLLDLLPHLAESSIYPAQCREGAWDVGVAFRG